MIGYHTQILRRFHGRRLRSLPHRVIGKDTVTQHCAGWAVSNGQILEVSVISIAQKPYPIYYTKDLICCAAAVGTASGSLCAATADRRARRLVSNAVASLAVLARKRRAAINKQRLSLDCKQIADAH